MECIINQDKETKFNKFILIKKYSNRRLYNSSESKYITQKELKEIICNGSDIKVVDYSSGVDLTKITLMQVLNDINEKEGEIFSVKFLKKLIKLSTKKSFKKLGGFLDLSIKKFEKNKYSKLKKSFSKNSFQELEHEIIKMKKKIKTLK